MDIQKWYDGIEDMMRKHRSQALRIQSLRNTLNRIQNPDGDSKIHPLSAGMAGRLSSTATVTIANNGSGGAEEFQVPIENCEDMIRERLAQLEDEEFLTLDKIIQSWYKDCK